MKFPRIANAAKFIAIGAVPLGFLAGWLLSFGQDAAGAGMIQGLMVSLGIVIAIAAGIIYFLARNDVRLPRLAFAFDKKSLPKAVVTLVLFSGLIIALYTISGSRPQLYTLSVAHRYDDDITGVVIRVGTDERVIDRIQPNMGVTVWELETRPELAEVSWMDPAGVLHQAAMRITGKIPERYHGGHVRATIVSPDEVFASFLFPK